MNLPGDTKGWREGCSEMGDGESGRKRGGWWGWRGVSIVLAECGIGGQYPTWPLDVSVRACDSCFLLNPDAC